VNRFRAIIFDMDGVIIDSEPFHEKVYRQLFEEMGYGDTHGVDFSAYYGKSDQALLTDFIARHQLPHSLEALAALKQSRFIDLIRREEPIFSGLPELVETLASRYRLAVASGSRHPVIAEVLAMKGLRRHFPVVVSVEDVAQPKPAPDVFLRAAHLLGLAPETCCVIEDATVGVTAARRAGMGVIAITNSLPREQLSHADRIVESYGEIGQWLAPATP
jgi:HAD superfamily hydrolase (TIGR01509 family)